jgi:hypothetical protein
MQNHDERLVELMSLMLDEMREMKQEQRQTRVEIREMKHEMREIKDEMRIMNTRVGGIEYVVREERVEFRSHIERLETAVTKAGFM